MKGRPRIDEQLRKDVSERLKLVFKGRSLPEIARELDSVVSSKTLWEYTNGISLPSPPVQLKIAEKFGVSLDWLLIGKEPVTKEPRAAACDSETLRLSIEAVQELLSAEGLSLKPHKFAELVTIVYEDSLRENVEPAEIKTRALKLLRLAT